MIVSLPAPPSSRFARLLPVSVSLKDEPVRFSTRLSVSVPAPPVFCAAVVRRLTVTAAVADA